MINSQRSEQNRAILQKIVEILNMGDLSEVDLIFSLDYIDHQKPPEMDIDGPDEFKQIVLHSWQSGLELKVTIEDLIAEGGKVVGRLQWNITDQSGKSIKR